MKSTLIIASLLTLGLSAPTSKRQNDLQTFTGALGGITATPVVDSGNPDRPFQVKGDTFVNIAAALQRSCDQQFNACANAANGGDKTLSVSACQAQKDQCDAAGQGASNNQAATGNANGNANANANANTQAPVNCGSKKAKRSNKPRNNKPRAPIVRN